MAKYSRKKRGTTKTINHEGAEAYTMPTEFELYSMVCTTVLDNQFYRKADTMMDRMRELIGKVDPEFVAKLAVYAREKMYLRTVPLVLTVELAKIHKGDDLVSRMTERVIQRADELYEILACYKEINNMPRPVPLSRQISKGVAKAFNKFSEYNFGKYNRDYEIKLKDAMFICRPKPLSKEQEKLFKKIADDELEIPDTWEVALSKNDGKTRKEKWERLIEEKVLGYMATLRNLRNILDAEVSQKHIKLVAGYLSNEKAVKNSRQFPFRFLSAFREIESHSNINTEQILYALEEAAKISVENVSLIMDGYNVIACDVSGSMEHSISERSKVQYYDIGLILGQLLKLRVPNSIVGIFGEDWKVKRFSSQSPLANTMALHEMEGEVGYSTNGWKVIDYLIQKDISADRVFFFTDGQLWSDWESDNVEFNQIWTEYKKNIPHAEAYFFDLAGYGNTPLSILDGNVYFVSGWSEKIFVMLAAIREGSNAIKEIEKIEL